jgi:hypothetical protein
LFEETSGEEMVYESKSMPKHAFYIETKIEKREREKESRGEMRTNEKCLKVCAEANTILNPFIVKVKRQLFVTLFE